MEAIIVSVGIALALSLLFILPDISREISEKEEKRKKYMIHFND